MKVYFFPPTSPYNPYIDNMVKGLENNGVIITNKGDKNKYDRLFSSIRAMFHHTDIFHFNWIENKSSGKNFKNRAMCRFILFWFSLIKLSGGKLVWTMHNRESHFAEGSSGEYHHAFLKKLISRMDMILVHAGESVDLLKEEYGYPAERICYVPHGNYIDENAAEPVWESHDRFTILCFGMVMRYKNVPLLIKAFNELNLDNASLLIYGKADKNDEMLKREIESSLAESSFVEYKDGFVPDEEVDDLFRKSDVVIMPYDKGSMMNSGAVIKALSEGRPVIASAFGAVRDISDEEFVYMYDYSGDEEHKEALKAAILKAYDDWRNDKETLQYRGRKAYAYAKETLSWDRICSVIVEKYNEIKG